MRRALSLVLALLLGAGLPAAAFAQAVGRPVGFGSYGLQNAGIIDYQNASVTVANSTTETQIYNFSIPSSVLATAPLVNYLATGTATPSTTPPVHLQMKGMISSTSGVTNRLQIGVQFGGLVPSTTADRLASVVTSNALPASLTNTPFHLDVWIIPSSASSTVGSGGGAVGTGYPGQLLIARIAYQSGTASGQTASETVYNLATMGSVNMRSGPNALNVTAQWGSANASNALNIYSAVLREGF